MPEQPVINSTRLLEDMSLGILKLAADSKKKLRCIDVDRVMEQAAEENILEWFRTWLLNCDSFNDPATAEAIRNWTLKEIRYASR